MELPRCAVMHRLVGVGVLRVTIHVSSPAAFRVPLVAIVAKNSTWGNSAFALFCHAIVAGVFGWKEGECSWISFSSFGWRGSLGGCFGGDVFAWGFNELAALIVWV